MSELDRCHTCGGDVGEHYGQCPGGAQPLQFGNRHWGGIPTLLADMPRENLRLRVDDQVPEQPDLFGGSPTD